jgi:DNA (cytosine-5)-methyltransferase 1
VASNLYYIDLFAGCGGLSLGLHNAGWKGLFAIEKSPDAFKTLKHNLIDKKDHFDWPSWLTGPANEPYACDITNVVKAFKARLIGLQGKVDLVAGGPPCQGFSMAGRRKENDVRNNLVKSYIKFIRLVQPKLIFFENVKGFTQEFKKNKDKGKKYSNYVETALRRAGIGYHVKGELVNFAEYGVPQKRTRFILVGIRKDLPNASKETAKSFFEKLKENSLDFLKQKNLSVDVTLEDAISDLLEKNGKEQSPDTKGFKAGKYNLVPKSSYQKLMRGGIKNIIADSHRFVNHKKDIIEKFDYIIKHNSTKNKAIDDSIRIKYSINKHTVIPLDKDDKSPTITSLPDDCIHYCEPRILTVREYARIQSFPDWFEIKGKYTTGGKLRKYEVPRYTQIGNAIPPLFGEQSGYALKQLIL